MRGGFFASKDQFYANAAYAQSFSEYCDFLLEQFPTRFQTFDQHYRKHGKADDAKTPYFK